MEFLFARIYEQDDPRFWIFTIGIIILSGAAVIGYLKIRTLYSGILKNSYLYFLLLGLFPLFSLMWIGMLNAPYSDIFLAVSLYWIGIALILLQHHASIFLQEIPKDCSNPILQQQWILMNKIKEQIIFCFVGVIYFFAMGTCFLCFLLTN